MKPELELRHLWYFVAVAEELSFSRAALRVGIAQPPLSQQIQKLERTVGTALFDRTGRRVRLTVAGGVLLAEARRLLGDAEHTLELARRAARGETGALTIGFWPSTLFSPLPAAVRAFREKYPSVLVRLREIFPPEHVEALQRGTLDVAILREPAPEEGLLAITLFVEPFVAVVPAEHRLAQRKRIPVSALRDEPFVLFPREAAPGLHAQIIGLCQRAGFTPRVSQEVEAWHTIVSLVEAGIGVSLIPASFAGRRTGALAYLPLEGPPVTTKTLACARSAGRSAAAESFLEVLRTEAARPPARPAPSPGGPRGRPRDRRARARR